MKLGREQVAQALSETNVKCRECDNIIETVDRVLCIHCRLDAEDRAAGRYQEYEE